MRLSDWSINQAFLLGYITADIVCILIFCIILFRSIRQGKENKREKLFNAVLIFHVIYFVLEIFWAPLNFNVVDFPIAYLKTIRALKYIIVSFGTYVWFLFIEYNINKEFLSKIKRILILGIPTIISAIISIIICTIFEPDSNSLDQNIQAIIMTFIPFMYMIYAISHAIFKIFRHKEILNKRSQALFSAYPLSLVLFASLQITFDLIPILPFGTTINMLSMYLTNLTSKISKDPLTGINNRNELNRYVYNNIKPNDNVYLVMLDVDNFKHINDTFGHVEGDKALKIIAKTLSLCIGESGSKFLARYGGDEFIIIIKDSTQEDLLKLLDSIDSHMDNLAYLSNDYSISLSIGYAKMESNEDFKDLIIRADKRLYKQKFLRKRGEDINV